MKSLFLSDQEREQALHGWNATAMPYPAEVTVPELIARHAAAAPSATAVVAPDARLDYGALNVAANRIAHRLIELGAGPGALVVIHLERTSLLAVAVLAVLKTGAAYVPTDGQQPAARLRHALDDAAVVGVLTERSVAERLPPTGATLIVLDAADAADAADAPAAAPLTDPGVAIDPSSVACVVYTSGSTGLPKGVQLTHANLAGMYFGWEKAYELGTTVRAHCQMMNFSFVVFQADFIRALCSGGKLVICPLETVLDPSLLYQTMRAEEVDFAEFVPAVLRNLVRFLEETGRLLDFLRFVVVGSDRWHFGEHTALAGYCGPGTRVVHSFGLTETSVDSAYFEGTTVTVPQGQLTPIGRPFPNVRLYILDEGLEPVPIGVQGELYIGGVGVTAGYRNDPAETAKRFVRDPFGGSGLLYRTGDLARYLADGNIQFLGRGDAQIKVRGFRVEPGEIELALREHPGVRDAAVALAPGADGADRLVAWVVPARAGLARLSRHRTMQLPEGLEVVSLNDAETHQFHQEIFVDQLYTRHGVSIRPGDCVFDVGANVGMFTLFAHTACPRIAIYAFEPSPEAFEALSLNAALHDVNAQLFDCGLSGRAGEAELTFYPMHAGMSTLYGDAGDEKQVLGTILTNQYRDLADPDLTGELAGWMDEHLEARTHRVRLRTLSDVMAEHDIDHIDLLKIVVQKSEADVLHGIDDADWPRVRQVVLEVYDRDGRLETLRSLLAGKGFRVEVEQAPLFAGTVVHLMYAVREQTMPGAREVKPLAATAVTANGLHEHLSARLADYMVPRGYVFLEQLPLTSTGKIDRQAMPLQDVVDLQETTEYVAPRNPVEEALAEIWGDLLGVAKVGVNDDFYRLGGHSLMATRVLSRLRQKWSIELPMRVFLRVRTIDQLAREVQAMLEKGMTTQPAPRLRPVEREQYRR